MAQFQKLHELNLCKLIVKKRVSPDNFIQVNTEFVKKNKNSIHGYVQITLLGRLYEQINLTEFS